MRLPRGPEMTPDARASGSGAHRLSTTAASSRAAHVWVAPLHHNQRPLGAPSPPTILDSWGFNVSTLRVPG